MTRAICLTIVSIAFNIALAAQAAAPQLPRGQMPDLGRTTKGDDQVPLFDFDAYFLGTWTFEWDMPDGPFGPAGRVDGTIVYTKAADGSYQASTTATGPSGKFTIEEVIRYDREKKTVSRQVTDSRGFSYAQKGTVGGDLGGFYNIYFESEPFKVGSESVVLKHSLRLSSPLNYRMSATVSVDGSPFRNYGTPWVRKEMK